MSRIIASFVVVLIIFGLMDAAWLGLVARSFYKEKLGALLTDNPRLGVAAVFYLIYAIGLAVFAVVPAQQSGSALSALGSGALFGLCAYAAYDLSNLATLRGFPDSLAIVDLVYGTCASAVAALLAFLATRAFFS